MTHYPSSPAKSVENTTWSRSLTGGTILLGRREFHTCGTDPCKRVVPLLTENDDHIPTSPLQSGRPGRLVRWSRGLLELPSPREVVEWTGCCQLLTSKLVGLSVGLPSVALPARKPHASDFLIRGFLRWLPCRESEGLDQHPLTPGLADRQPVPPTASGPVGRICAFDSESHQASALPPTAEAGGLLRCYR